MLVERLRQLFGKTSIVDRRTRPSYGYRAVHVILAVKNRLVEVQVRTALQHKWAEYSEKLADRFSFELRYGGGPTQVRDHLMHLSNQVSDFETLEAQCVDAANEIMFLRLSSSQSSNSPELVRALAEPKQRLVRLNKEMGMMWDELSRALQASADPLGREMGQDS